MAEIGVSGADFDGANDYMLRGAGLSGAADSKTGILSAWVRKDGADGVISNLIDFPGVVGGAGFNGTNKFFIAMPNGAGSNIFNLNSLTSYTAGPAWLHVLISWDLATGASHLYVNDVSDSNVLTLTNDTIDYTHADFAVGAATSGIGKVNGCVAELYFAPGQYLDFSVEANRRKFISAAGRPADLGADGSTPTGSAPLVYLHLDPGEAVANFAINSGTGGNFSITGSLDTASSSPSDIRLTATGVASAEAFGTANVGVSLLASAIAGAEAFGTGVVSFTMLPAGIGSAEAFGLAAAQPRVQMEGVASAEAFGTATLGLYVSGAGAIATAEAFGTPVMVLYVAPEGIESGEAVGTPSFFFKLPREMALVGWLTRDMDFER